MFDDALVRAIRRKIAPDEMTALRNAERVDLHAPRESVNVPLRADVRVAYDRNLAAFGVDARILDTDPKKWLCARQYFSTREIVRASDRAALIEYLLDGLKQDMLRTLADEELEKLLKVLAA